jgi:hypothetical protein
MLNGTLAFPPVIFTRTNSLLLTDSIANLQRIERVLAELQRPRTDVLTRAYDLKFANAALLARSLQQALASPLIGQPAFGAVIAPDERTNRVLVTGNAEQQDFVADLVAKLDVKSDPSTRTEVLPLRHAAAPDVATLLTQLITGQNTAARAQAGGRTPANATNRTPAPAANAAATTPAAATSGAEEFSQGVTVVADTRSNAIVASGTADDLRLLRALVEQVDVLLAQVRIEVVIAEVTLTDNASSGIQQLGLTVTGSKLTGFSGAGPGFAVTNGAVLAGSSTDLSATIGLTSTPRKSDTNILSNPSVTTTHNKEATIFVGESRPVVTGTTATATVANGAVTGFTITNPGSGYAIDSPKVTIASPPALAGTVTPQPFVMRALLHVADGGTATLLSQVFVGQLAAPPHSVGICTQESLLKADAKATAQRLVAAHMPLDRVLITGSGAVTVPGVLSRTITIPFDDQTNPFVHQYHPDHDNRDARPDGTNTPKGNGDESYTLTRTCSFTFTATPPEGVSSTGWGSSAIGGTYTEIFRGLHRDALVVSGTFVLRRVSEAGAITLNN